MATFNFEAFMHAQVSVEADTEEQARQIACDACDLSEITPAELAGFNSMQVGCKVTHHSIATETLELQCVEQGG